MLQSLGPQNKGFTMVSYTIRRDLATAFYNTYITEKI